MGGGNGDNRTALGIRQAKDKSNEAGELMADSEEDNTGEMAVAEKG